jgi:hypothetical protein
LLEDPDFEETPRVGYALLVLYSQYLRAVTKSEQQLSLFVLDQLGRDFTLLGEKISRRVALSELDGLFDRVGKVHTFEGDIIWRLSKRKKRQPTLRRADLSILPDEIYVRESLLASQRRQPEEQVNPASIQEGRNQN